VEKYGRAGQVTNDSTIRRLRFESWIIKAAVTHSEYVILCHGNSCNAKTPLCYVILTLPLLFKIILNSCSRSVSL